MELYRLTIDIDEIRDIVENRVLAENPDFDTDSISDSVIENIFRREFDWYRALDSVNEALSEVASIIVQELTDN